MTNIIDITLRHNPLEKKAHLKDEDKNGHAKPEKSEKIDKNGKCKINVVTEAYPGTMIRWNKDVERHNIREIISIFPKKKDGKIFKGRSVPKIGDDFVMIAPNCVCEEEYNIMYFPVDEDFPVIVDPTVKIPPP